MKIRRRPWRLVGDGWAIVVAVFCGERWYSPRSWGRYSLFGKLTWDRGFHVGPILFWKEG